jgi:methyl-accepting chemotaxis protein
MKSIKVKLMLPVLLMLIVFTSFLAMQFIEVNSNLNDVKEMRDKDFAVLSKADELKFSVVQVQQWLTDISATRAANGFDDGFSKADSYAKNAEKILKDITKINPKDKNKVKAIHAAFEPYYSMGKKMANEYISGGPASGNLVMDKFDKTAEKINSKVDKFKNSSYKEFQTTAKQVQTTTNNILFMIFSSIIIGIIISFISWLFISKKIINPILNILERITEIASSEGDLTKRVKISSSDEIGQLGKMTNKLMENFGGIIIDILDRTRKLDAVSEQINVSMSELNTNIDHVSASTDNLSSDMEETAASTEEMSATSNEIESAVQSIAEQAQSGQVSADEINKRASELKSSVVMSRDSAKEIYENTSEKLKAAIEETKAVDKINELLNSILNITNQTNMLALNASIEATRAGEAGRGFAIVAESIRTLADDSKNTANEIQNIIKLVVNSVDNMSGSAQSVLEFIDQQVMKDYEMLVHTGEQYSKDAEFVDDMVTNFSAVSEQLLASIENMTKAINDVAVTANEGASNTINMAKKSKVIATKSADVIELTRSSKDNTDKLFGLVSKFRV